MAIWSIPLPLLFNTAIVVGIGTTFVPKLAGFAATTAADAAHGILPQIAAPIRLVSGDCYTRVGSCLGWGSEYAYGSH